MEFPVFLTGFYGLQKSEIMEPKGAAIDFTYKTIFHNITKTNATINGKYVPIQKDRVKKQEISVRYSCLRIFRKHCYLLNTSKIKITPTQSLFSYRRFGIYLCQYHK